MQSISWLSVLFYCLFGMFVFYQQLHVRSFRGSSKGFEAILTLSAIAGMITGLAYLIYYGWTVVWWAPILIFVVGILFTIVGVFVERLLGLFALSLLGFIGWPLCALAMFKHIPN
ncbi:hypothetical protein [Prosthecobacter sp.]|uniref:hypothetical protein n=1 Tax=Prosthecobacter sp. TaxID=1965333 RepID=UPI002ABBC00A|nr:hypothetical protein [Prosthecobacter sp.]MDZ4406233.1 hypothetical protein [Prosthecobacter sp.]